MRPPTPRRRAGRSRTRTCSPMTGKARAGHCNGGRCFGYQNVPVLGPDGRRSHVARVVVEAEAAVIRRAFQLCAAGVGLERIAKQLNDEGLPAPRTKMGRPQGW